MKQARLGAMRQRTCLRAAASRLGTRPGGHLGGARATRFARPGRGRVVPCRASEEPATSVLPVSDLEAALRAELDGFKTLPPSEKDEVTGTGGIMAAMRKLQEAGQLPLWGSCAESTVRRNVFPGELVRGPTKLACEPAAIATPSVRNDAVFLGSVVGLTSLIATIAGVALPGDWGFFVPYLCGGISLVVLAVGSTAPGLLSAAISRFSLVFPDYRERTLRHEAAHFLLAYLLGAPIARYSLDLLEEHVQLAQALIQRRANRLSQLSDEELDRLATIAMAGVAAEAMYFDKVMGQTEDLNDLQSLINKSATKLSASQQQNLTRWAVVRAVGLLQEHAGSYDRLMDKMQQGAPVFECIQAIEGL